MLARGVILISLLSLGLGAVAEDYINPCPPTPNATRWRFDYPQALCMSILFYEAQRSGALPPDQRVTWRGDSALDDGSDQGVDLSGGYYDAGDHVKFGFPFAGSMTVLCWGLLSYWDAYDAAGQVEYAQAAIKWGTDYLLKAHTANMTLWVQVGDAELDHAYWGRPEDMTMDRPALVVNTSAPGSDVAGESAAALAAASIVFKDSDPDYSAELLAVSEDLYQFADQYRELYQNSVPNGGYYPSNSYEDELALAALWLYKATGDQQFADKATAYWDEFNFQDLPPYLDWNAKNLFVQVLYVELFHDQKYRDKLQSAMEEERTSRPLTPQGMAYIGQWGSARLSINAALAAFQTAELDVDADINRSWAMQQLDYLLGCNGHSFVVGFGMFPPQRPHHRSSSCPDAPSVCDDGWALNQVGPNPQVLYGGLVGGPDQEDGHVDDRNNYVQNEVALDYNAALPGSLGAALALYGF